jgi:hypothetical protein
MLDKIIHFSIHNKLVIGILVLCWVIWGVYSFAQLPIDAVPDVTNNQVQVITRSPSLAASEVERLITFPVELTMATIPHLTEIRSFSRFGLSVVTIVFTDDTDVYWARQQVFERLTQAQAQIPAGVGNPELAPVTTGLGEIFQYVLRVKPGFAHKYTPMDLRTVQDWIVRRQLLGTKGVADVSSFGGYLKQYEIAVDPAKLRAADVSIDEILTALEQNNQNTGGAYIDKQPQAYFIRSEGLIGSLADLGQVVVRSPPGGSPLLIRDVAKVQWGHAVRYGAMTYNDQGEAVGGIVMMLKGDNSSEVIANVKARIQQIQTSLPDGLEIEGFLDRTKLVNSAIGTVGLNLAEGALIVIFVLVLLLGNLRAGLVVASVIPLAMLFAVGMMNLFAPPVGNLPLTKRPAPPLDTAALGLNPGLALLQQHAEVARKQVAVEKARFWPDLSLGYFNQSLIGTYRIGGQDQFLDGRRRFSGFQVGMALPLWARPQKARLGAARLGAQVAQTQADLLRKNLHAQLAAAAQQLAKQQAALQLFERQWLPNADLLQANAQKAFAAGEIGYWEYAQALTRAHAARVAHLAALNGYNQAVIRIEFLLGDE